MSRGPRSEQRFSVNFIINSSASTASWCFVTGIAFSKSFTLRALSQRYDSSTHTTSYHGCVLNICSVLSVSKIYVLYCTTIVLYCIYRVRVVVEVEWLRF